MSASDNLSSQLFHGTAHAFKPGDVVTPQRHVAAFATERSKVAEAYAQSRAEAQGMLFGMVYEVEPVKDDLKQDVPLHVRTSRTGFRVKGLKGYSV